MSEHHLESESLSRLVISPVLEQDGGEVSCEAANRFGRDHKHFYLSVEDVPAPPSGVRLSHLASRSAEINWHAPHDGNSPILNYVIEYANLPGEGEAEIVRNGTTFISINGSSGKCVMLKVSFHLQGPRAQAEDHCLRWTAAS